MGNVHNLVVDEELTAFLPKLSEEALKELKNNLLRDGCTDLVIVRDGKIVDGHPRYLLCYQYGIPFEMVEKHFLSKDDAIFWMMSRQKARKEMNSFERLEAILPYEAKLKKLAKIVIRKKKKEGVENLTNMIKIIGEEYPDFTEEYSKTFIEKIFKYNAVDMQSILAEICGMSTGSVSYARRIIESSYEDLKDAVRCDEMSIYAAAQKVQRRMKLAKEEAE